MKALRTYSWLVVVFLWSPILSILWKGCSLNAFASLARNESILNAFMQSLFLAFATALLSTILGLLTAFALPRLGRGAKKLVEGSILLPLVLPEIAFGLAYLVWYEALGIPLGWGTLLLSHVAFTYCYSSLVLRTSVEQLDWSMLDAAHDLGASLWQGFHHAILPQLLPGLAASAMLSFSLSLDDFLISFFVKGISQVTLPIKIYSMMRLRISPEIYALSILLFAISIGSALITRIWFQNAQKRS